MQHDLCESAVENRAVAHVLGEKQRGEARVSMVEDERLDGGGLDENRARTQVFREYIEERNGLTDAERGERGQSEGVENEIDEMIENGHDVSV